MTRKAQVVREVILVLGGAVERMNAGGYAKAGCCCERREDDEVPVEMPYPAPVASTWCFLCAVEASQKEMGLDAERFGQALSEVAFEVSGVRRPGEFERDEILFDWTDSAGEAEIVATFSAAWLRVRTEAGLA